MLEKYKEKRNFSKTTEPGPKKKEGKGLLKFVVQRHAASHLHYDFRLEMEGVLKSWAVPKGPSLDPHDKRLAMMVEDHPFDYRTFEGIIPEGNYGAGIVEIWDEGEYHAIGVENREESEKKMLEDIKEGSLKFVLHGKKLKGEFALVKLKSDKKNAWLLIKHKDEFAWNKPYDSEDHVSPHSKIKRREKRGKTTSGNSGKYELNQKHDKQEPGGKGDDKMPHGIKPMLARLVDEPFDSKDWIFEIKWDGYRAIAEIESGNVWLYSRNLLSFNHKYARIVNALKKLGVDAVLDGEVVVLNENGFSSFQKLQNYEENPEPNLFYMVFDILYLNGHDLRELPLTERKKVLHKLLEQDLPGIKYCDYLEEKGVDFFNAAKKNAVEGIIAKKANSHYQTGIRSGDWLKIKVTKRQEAIICGFTDPKGSRKELGALVLGVYENGILKYIGHTGGGFNTASLNAMKQRLIPLITDKSPFKEKVKTNAPVTWVEPGLICEISFSEWTGDGHLRQPIFVGMREDKKPEEVVVEKEKSTSSVVEEEQKTRKKTTNEESMVKVASSKNKKEQVEVNGQKLIISNPDKIYWPEEGYTKGDLIEYYSEIAPYMLPYLKDRPENLNRHPSGIHGESFYQKDMGDKLPDWIASKDIYSESNNKEIRYLVCQNEATLLYMANLGCIEINPWNSRIQSLEYPDYIVIDLDPGENTFEEVIETALVVKEVLDRGNIVSFPKTSGSTGLHIFIPMGAKYDYEQGKNFAHIIAELVHAKLPKLTSLERSPKDRRKQIYLDYLQNRTGQTLAAAYSVRPKPGATVSTPLEWSEIKTGLHPSKFTIKNILKRIEQKGDLFKGVLGKGVDMHKCLEKLG